MVGTNAWQVVISRIGDPGCADRSVRANPPLTAKATIKDWLIHIPARARPRRATVASAAWRHVPGSATRGGHRAPLERRRSHQPLLQPKTPGSQLWGIMSSPTLKPLASRPQAKSEGQQLNGSNLILSPARARRSQLCDRRAEGMPAPGVATVLSCLAQHGTRPPLGGPCPCLL